MGSSLAVSNNWCRKLSTTCIFLGPREVSDKVLKSICPCTPSCCFQSTSRRLAAFLCTCAISPNLKKRPCGLPAESSASSETSGVSESVSGALQQN